jgi:hypothetical protein
MRRSVLAVALLMALLACATPPRPKAPDQSRRTPVNKTVPAELRENRPVPEDRP